MHYSSRRAFLTFTAAAFAGACSSVRSAQAPSPAAPTGSPPTPSEQGPDDALAELESAIGGRVGVFALDSGSRRTVAHRADERFAMCSTFKWALVAAVLQQADRGEIVLSTPVSYGEADLLEYAPVARENLGKGSMTIEELARAAALVSDNTAANLLLDRIGGPAGFTQFMRSVGDDVTRLDRTEPTLNTNETDDERDTTSPKAMAGAMSSVLTGDVLEPSSREQLTDWLVQCETGRDRLRAGLPQGWKAGDKTGTGMRGAVNDVAVVWPPGQAPIFIAAYLSGSELELDSLNKAHAAIARHVVGQLAKSDSVRRK